MYDVAGKRKTWVCAYANNQFELGKDLSNDPRESSFFRAMQLAVGVLLVLDPEATPFTRIWCAFEQATVVDGALPLLLDIATATDGSAATITDDGPTPTDEEERKKWGRERRERKIREGEQPFPMELFRKSLDIRVELAEASMAIDKTRILNSISGQTDLDRAPPASHPKFDEVITNGMFFLKLGGRVPFVTLRFSH